MKKYERILTYAIFTIIALWFLSLSTCNKNTSYKNQQSTIDSFSLVSQKYDSVINNKNQTILIQTSIVTDDQNTIKKLTDSIFNLKKKSTKKSDKVIAYVSTYTDTELEEYLLGFKDTSEFREFSDSVSKQCEEVLSYMKDSTIKIPKQLEDSTKDFKFNGVVTKEGLKINTLSFPDSTYLRFVEHNGGLLKKDTKGKRHFLLKKSVEIQILHTNPHVKTKGINSIIYIPKAKQRWLERAIIIAGASFLTYKIIK